MSRSGSRRLWPAAAYLVLVGALTVVLWQSASHLSPEEAGLSERPHLERGDTVLGSWMYWDGEIYHSIADQGYTDADKQLFRSGGEANVAFFPVYPILGRVVAAALGDLALSLIVVALASGLALSVVLHRWFVAHLESSRAATLAVLAVFLFPWAYVLTGAAYTEALFLVCTVGAFVLVERDRPVAAGMLGAVASGTRIVGVAVVIGLVLRTLERRGALRFEGWRPRISRGDLRRRDAAVLLSGLGVASFVAFCWIRYGDPIAFSTAQRGWGSPFGPRTWFKIPLFDLVTESPDLWFVRRLLLHGFVGFCFCLAVPAVWRRFGAAYGSYTAVVVLLPMVGSAAFSSMGRLMLVAFPVFGLVGEQLAAWRPAKAVAVLAASGSVLVLWTSFWARGYWMA